MVVFWASDPVGRKTDRPIRQAKRPEKTHLHSLVIWVTLAELVYSPYGAYGQLVEFTSKTKDLYRLLVSYPGAQKTSSVFYYPILEVKRCLKRRDLIA